MDDHSEDAHELFRCEADRWNWEKFIQQCDRIELEETIRQRAKDSFSYLRKTLGTGFLKRACKERHPIYVWYFANAAPDARHSLIQFVDALRSFENVRNFKRLLKRVNRPLTTKEDLQDITEAMSAFEMGHRFLQAGFRVELEPTIRAAEPKGHQRTKSPDLKIIDRENGQTLIVEMSRMLASDNQRLISNTHEVVFNLLIHWGMHSDPEALKDVLNPRHILPYAIIHRGIEQDELTEILQRLKCLIENVRSTGDFGELVIPETIEVGIASYDNHDLAKKWALERGMREGDMVQGASIESDEVARAKRKIREKLKQLPADLPRMLVIEAKENLLLFVYDTRVLTKVFEEEVRRHRNLARLVVFHSFVDGSTNNSSVNIGPHTFRHQAGSDSSTEESLTIRNIDLGIAVPSETLAKVDSVFGPSNPG